MFSLGHILDTRYLAHTTLAPSYSLAADAIESLTLTESSQADSQAAIISHLLQGDIAAQGQAVYNSQTAISMLQVFDAAACQISETLAQMEALAKSAQSGVYSEAELALIQIGFEDLTQTINTVAEETEVNGYHLLAGDGDEVTIYLGNNTSTDILSTNLGFTSDVDLTSDPAQALEAVADAASATSEYRAYLGARMDTLAAQVAIAESQVGRQLGYSLDLCNRDLARQLALEVVSEIMSQDVASIQALVSPSRVGVMGLLNQF